MDSQHAVVRVFGLRCLLILCPDRWPLTTLWNAVAQNNNIGRAQGCTASFIGIARQLRLSRALAE